MRKKRVLFLLCCMVFLAVPVSAHAASAEMTLPSQKESTIASGRGFYIAGTFSEGTIPGAQDGVKIELVSEGGVVVRSVMGLQMDPQLKVDTGNGLPDTWGDPAALPGCKMPDLIWDGTNAASFYNGDHKLYYDEAGFTALIPGGIGEGITDDKMNWVDSNGASYAPIHEGAYRVRLSVKAAVGTETVEEIGTIVIGVTPDKVLARFSPQEHMDKVTQLAESNGWRIYNDPFAGYWPTGSCEIKTEMRAADIEEYKSGRVHYVIYNMKNTSASYSVELAALQLTQSVENPDRLQNYYYQYGEPALKDGKVSEIVAFAPGDKLQLTRTEVLVDSAEENIYDQDNTQVPKYDLNLADGIAAEAGETVDVYGVTAPIQIAAEEVIDNGNNSYTLKNKIQTVKYDITGDGIELKLEKPVILNRKSGGWDNPSELEFKHELPISEDMAGKNLQVAVSGYDAKGVPVPGTTEEFQIMVKGKGEETPPAPEPPEKTETPKAIKTSPDASPKASPKTGDEPELLFWITLLGLGTMTTGAFYRRR